MLENNIEEIIDIAPDDIVNKTYNQIIDNLLQSPTYNDLIQSSEKDIIRQNIVNSEIIGGKINIGFGNNIFKVDPSQGLWLGNTLFSLAPFKVTMAGVVTASSLSVLGGVIGGWSINTTSIYTGTEDHNGYTTNPGDLTIYSNGSIASIHANNFYIDADGILNCKEAIVAGAITAGVGSSIASDYLSGIIAQANLNVSNRGWVQTSAFSTTDADTVAWGAGTFTSADGTTYSIGSGNTGNMTAKTYIYLDTIVSVTAYQITTTATTAVGVGKVLIAIAQNGTTEATYQVLQGQGGQNIDAANIVAGSITANEIAASTITAGLMSVATLSAITANLGTITAGTINGVTITGSTINVTTGELAFYDTTYKRMRVDTSSSAAYFQLYDNSEAVVNSLFLTMPIQGSAFDSYSESNYNSHAALTVDNTKVGQSITGVAGKIHSCKFYLQKQNFTTGNAYVKLYEETHATAFGTDSVPTGSVLATSDPYDTSNLPSSYSLIEFTFPVGQRYEMIAEKKYCIVLEYAATGILGILLGSDNSSPTHSGNLLYWVDGTSSWASTSSNDLCFYTYLTTDGSLYSTYDSNLGISGSKWSKAYIKRLYLSASTTKRCPLNIPVGLDMTVPVNGDIWYLSNKGLRFYDGTEIHDLVMSDGSIGGSGSAGAGNQYVEMELNGLTYKILHDGTV